MTIPGPVTPNIYPSIPNWGWPEPKLVKVKPVEPPTETHLTFATDLTVGKLEEIAEALRALGYDDDVLVSIDTDSNGDWVVEVTP